MASVFYTGKCFFCRKHCFIECGKCYAILRYLGEKHHCPNPDEGFYDQDDGDVLRCVYCDKQGFLDKSKQVSTNPIRQANLADC